MTEIVNAPSEPTAAPLEPCASCAAPLVGDQRWCLNCGTRRAGVATPFAPASTGPPVAPVVERERTFAAAAPAPVDAPPRWVLAAVGLGLAAVLFALGLVVGLAGQDRRTLVNVPPGDPPVVNVDVQSSGAPVAETAALADETPGGCGADWPAKTDGWTVQLQTLPGGSDGAAGDGAKSDAEGKGASDVGALLSDDYASLKPNECVIYSGVYTSEGEAEAALGPLKKDFKKAKVIEVSATGASSEPVEEVSADELEGLQSEDPEEQQDASKKLPDKVGTVGTPPPADDTAPGGGTEGTTIG